MGASLSEIALSWTTSMLSLKNELSRFRPNTRIMKGKIMQLLLEMGQGMPAVILKTTGLKTQLIMISRMAFYNVMVRMQK